MTTAPSLFSVSGDSPEVVRAIDRCADAQLDAERLRGEVMALERLPGPMARFAAALFELELAKRGDVRARAAMLEIADELLGYWRDKSGDELASQHAALGTHWADATALLLSFEMKRFGRALAACWQARHDAAALKMEMEGLKPEGNRRVEFARCLYHLELARLFVDSSRLEFAHRIELVREAYLQPEVAKELVGDDEGLSHLWKDLVPYLDEFFEAQEEAEEKARRSLARTEPIRDAVLRTPTALSSSGVHPAINPTPVVLVPKPSPPPHISPSRTEPPSFAALTRDRGPISGVVALTPLLTNEPPPTTTDEIELAEIITDEEPTPVPGPPPLPPPLPPRTITADDEVEIVSVTALSDGPPPLPRTHSVEMDVLTDYEPSDAAREFWAHTIGTLDLLPNPKVSRGNVRILSADDRGARRKLNGWLESVQGGQFADVPDARAMECLLRVYMAAQIKKKTLFGGVNQKRVDAFRDALKLMSEDVEAAARAATWFELDGVETVEHLQSGLETVMEFLQFCAREGLSPLDEQAPDRFLEP